MAAEVEPASTHPLFLALALEVLEALDLEALEVLAALAWAPVLFLSPLLSSSPSHQLWFSHLPLRSQSLNPTLLSVTLLAYLLPLDLNGPLAGLRLSPSLFPVPLVPTANLFHLSLA
ncbi:hypothetical protein PG996_012933 [Apiospora saccharicola]|uniref:Uncharacterized protein n=1 Tax=Apiospora saccharicola TaxID=335842 RepID=A0ABR1U4M0_9PEZI